jgi:hypothetical protein
LDGCLREILASGGNRWRPALNWGEGSSHLRKVEIVRRHDKELLGKDTQRFLLSLLMLAIRWFFSS